MKYRFLIVDDDHASQEAVCAMVHEFLPDAQIVIANNSKTATSLMADGQFDALFLAVTIEGQDSFKLLQAIPHRNFELVILSEDADYALEAIKEGATDYLLKPLKRVAFREAIQKVVERRSQYLAYSKVPPDPNAYLLQKMSIPHQQGLWFITLQDIVYIKADNSYTTIYTTQGEKITTSKPISRFESTLSSPWFFRIHKSYLINTNEFKAYLSKSGDVALMSNGDKLLISRYRLSSFLEVVREMNGAIKM